MKTTHKFDGRLVIHKKYGEGILSGVNIRLYQTKYGILFKKSESDIFRVFKCKTWKFYKMLITKKIE